MLSIANPSFETGNLSEWDVYIPPGGSASAVTSYSNAYSSGTYSPVDGSYFAALKTDGPGSYTTVSQTFSAQIGDTISGWAFFDAEDYLPFNDNAQVTVKSGNTTVATLFFENIQGVGSYGQTPWTYWEHEFTAAGEYSIEARIANTGDSIVDSYMGLDAVVYVLGNPRVVGQSPSDPSVGPLGSVRLDFSEPIDQDTFLHEEDVVSFVGPEGQITVTGHQWIDEDTVELTFDLQYVVGTYDMVIGPEIRDMEDNPMDEAQTVTFVVGAPEVLDHTPSGSVPGPVDALELSFDHPMDQTSFSPDDDVISFTGPDGPLAVSGFQWLGDQTLEIQFDPQSSLGPYELVLGPEVLSLWNNPLDQDGDLIVAEAPDDWYTAVFTIAGAKVVEHSPSGYVTAPVQKMQFGFDQPMNGESFSPEDDVVSFTGPNGPIAITDHRWIDPQTLEVGFDQQSTAGEYELVLGPQILNLAGIAMDQDEDFGVGEEPDDQYTGTFTRMFVSNITEDTVWGPIDPPIIFDSTVTVASGATLTIEAGSTLKFSGGARLVVNGNLDIRGTVDNPVILTSYRDDESGGDTNGDGDASSPAANDWGGIDFNSSATGTLENVEIAYASTAIDANAQYANVTLRNAVLRDGGRGIYVYSPYAEIEAENVLIADNQRTGVYMRASSGGIFRNCTIVGNGFGASGLERAGIHIGAATMLFDNTIVAFNANGINHTSADDSQTTVRNSLFYNPAGQDIIWTAGGQRPSLDQDGNITADPLFVDRVAGNYELGPGSPAIDSGRGIHAPGGDILGRGRRDDQGMPNVGNGYPSFVDMGVYERQEVSPTADLIVTYVSHPDPEIVTAGDSFDLEWTVSNIGAMEAIGDRQDLVYLSDDPYLGGDELLATIDHSDPLAAGASYTETLTATVPATSGPKYILVHTKFEEASGQREAVETNNLGVSARVLAVDVPLLELGTPLGATATQGHWDYFRFEGEPGRTVLFALDGEAGSAELYLRRTLPPTLSSHDWAGSLPSQPDQELRLLDPVADTYYVGVLTRSLGGGSGSYTLSADLTTLDIREVAPNEVGNAGTATIKILGDEFTSETEARLVAPDGTHIKADEYFQDSSTVFAMFDLTGAEAGIYDVTVVSPEDAIATLPDIVTVAIGGAPEFRANLSMPGLTRPGRTIDVRVEYTNAGTNDLQSPLLKLHGLAEDYQWQLPGGDEAVIGSDLWFLALSSDGPPTVLRPGQTESVTVRLTTSFSSEDVVVYLSSLGGTAGDGADDTIDWDSLKEGMRPESVYADAWNAIWENLTGEIGGTWGDYVSTLNENANYLHTIGQTVADAGALLAFEIQQAAGLSPLTYLSKATDIELQSPGLRLSFERVFSAGIADRYEVGAFGRGWSHSWQISLDIDAQGAVTVLAMGGSRHLFLPDGRGAYLSQPGDHATLTTVESGFQLREKDGLITNFHPNGRFDYVQDTNGNQITASYTGDLLTRLTHSSGQWLEISYTDADQIGSMTDYLGRGVIFAYDAADEHLTSVTYYDGRTLGYAYDTESGAERKHTLTEVEYPDGSHKYYTYDEHGRILSVSRDGGAEAVTFAYGSAGTVSAVDALGGTAKFFFDHRGLVVGIEDALDNVVSMSFDDDYNLVQVIDPAGYSYSYSYDENGNLIAQTTPLGGRTTFTYADPLSRLSSVTDARGTTTRYEYDDLGNLLSITSPDGNVENFNYDLRGDLVASVNRRGNDISYTYDSNGMLTRKDYADGSFAEYVYDERANMTSATSAEGTIEMEYDLADRLSIITYPSERFLQFTYDSAGRRTQAVDQNGFAVSYEYDAVGRLAGLTDGEGTWIVAYSYDAVGRLLRKEMANGTYTIYEYDAVGQLSSLANRDGDHSMISYFNYTYDPMGMPIGVETSDGVWTYEYDAEGRIVSAVFDSSTAAVSDQVVAYVYDAVGNRVRIVDNGTPVEYASNRMNQYTTAGAVTYDYDADGNLISKVYGVESSSYVFDDENRLIEVVTPDGTWIYTYDAFGNRIATSHGAEESQYLLEPFGMVSVVAEYDGDDQLIARYIHSGGSLIGRVDPTGEIAYYTFDGQGNTTDLTDPSGDILNQYLYDPFGIALSATETLINPFQYSGEFGVMAEGNGLTFMRARFYDAEIGRFISRDPLRVPGRNSYTFAHNDPLVFVDPSGLDANPGAKALRGTGKAFHAAGTGISNLKKYALYAGAAVGTALFIFPELLSSAAGAFLAANSMAALKAMAVLEALDAGIPGGDNVWQVMGDTMQDNANGMRNRQPEEDTPEDAPTDPEDDGRTPKRTSYTPEDKFGPGGYDAPGTPEGSEVRFIPAGQTLDYRVEFWNKEDAPVPTQDAIIIDDLDPAVFDLSTLEITRVGFLNWDFEVSSGQTVDTRIDTMPEMNIAVEIKAGLGMEIPGFANNADIDENTLVFWFHTIDPETGEWPDDPFAGFLPPFNPETGFEIGWIEYRVDPVEGLASGTQLTNVAYVEFDFAGDIYDHPAPKVDPDVEPADPAPWINTLDVGVPESSVAPLPATSSQASFLVQWTGEDEENGSGLAGYDVLVSTDGGAYEEWLDGIVGTSAVFPGDFGHTYGFYSVATDNVGHREPAPATPDAQITIPPNENPVANDDFPVMDEDTVATIDVLTNDTDDGLLDPTTVRITLPASHGSLVNNGDGTFTYTPDADFHGSDSFQYKVKDEHKAESSAATVSITVDAINDPPEITSLSVTPTVIDEAGTVTVTGEFTDPDLSDVHTVVIDWNDGTSDTLTLDVGDRTFSATHPYPDDDPTGTFSDDYAINVTVTDDKAAGDSAGTTVTVNNVAPTLSDVSLTPEINEGEFATLSGTISDPGTRDTFTLEVDWADGSPLETFSFATGTTTFSVSHPYLDDNPSGTTSDDYTISFTLTDDDTGSAADAARVWTGPTMTFTKADYVDWTLPVNQDRITDNVWLTRQNNEGVFNIKTETYYDSLWRSWDEVPSPANTEWASGSASDWESLTFSDWAVWQNWSPPDTVGQDAVLHLVEEDVYLDIKFLSWTEGGNGGGFSYERATPAVPGEKVWTGPTIIFTKDDYADWTDPANQDRIAETTWITRRETKGLFNFKTELAYDLWVSSSPADTEWAFGSLSDWQSMAFGSWAALTGGWNEGPTSILGKDLVLHLISDDIYVDIKFTSWTSGGNGGGFSYERSTESAAELTTTVTVNNVDPTAAIEGAPESCPTGTPIVLSSSVIDPGIDDTFTYAWVVSKDGTGYASGTSADFSFTPDEAGIYEVSLEITDDDGGVGTDSKTIEVIATTPALELTAFDVQQGAAQRSYVRYLDLIFEEPEGVDELIAGSRVRLTRYGLDGSGGSDVDLTGVLSVAENKLLFDFGLQGIGGNRNSIAGDGYYEVGLDLDGNGSFETTQTFYRLFGDVNGDRTVSSLDVYGILAAYGQIGSNLENDANGDGVVNALDRIFACRSVGRMLDIGLYLDD